MKRLGECPHFKGGHCSAIGGFSSSVNVRGEVAEMGVSTRNLHVVIKEKVDDTDHFPECSSPDNYECICRPLTA
ncbi:hypothetical protein EO013_15860 [Escherichia coli]|nr:hypothetical protein CIW80_04210 [Escherichia coli Nissle 1917]EAA1121456.1 hypothetical protein [Escherichia coli]EFN7193149.1 hypothetical protein [Escherichia coli O2:H1]EFN7247478.1 hypothetical protein [Escherichia coli O2:H14]EFN7280854.1 hypothetical protein [Escherichia coli O11:H5]QBZ08898.1 hypothetical protein C7X15_17475 [Escherichia coli O18:H1]